MKDTGVANDSAFIDRVIVNTVLSGRLRAGMRRGEQALATPFAVSRASVREALIRLETRGTVQVNRRRGWFGVEPPMEKAPEALQAHCAIDAGILRTTSTVPPQVVAAVREPIRREYEATAPDGVEALGRHSACAGRFAYRSRPKTRLRSCALNPRVSPYMP